jgi:membrane fusion protein (multidrug efflux system)
MTRFGWPQTILLGAVGGVLAVGAVLYTRSTAGTNKVAMADTAKPVSVVPAAAQPFQTTRRYIGTAEPWLEARIGPQLVSALVDTVLVRPGAVAKRGDVLATLDCRNTSALDKQVAAQARAVDAMSTAAAAEASRLAQLLKDKYVSENEVDIKQADAASKQAQVAALKAQLSSNQLQVDDCVLRAPFDGEIAERFLDPGAFASPGRAIATLVDRHIVRIAVDVPEDDFDAVAPGTNVTVHLLSIDKDVAATISRRAPAAERTTRTAHVEIDVDGHVADADGTVHAIPVRTTAEVSLAYGRPIPATAIPLPAAAVHGDKATLFEVAGGHAHLVVADVVGEVGGTLYIDAKTVPAGALVVTQGRNVLADNDAVSSK